MMPKMHKTPVGERFIIASPKQTNGKTDDGYIKDQVKLRMTNKKCNEQIPIEIVTNRWMNLTL